jgi:aryl-alcohol dehydrogenase-like predicted oxidoreductase
VATHTARGQRPTNPATRGQYPDPRNAVGSERHDVPIPGTRRIGYLEQNLAVLQVQLTPDDRAALDHVGADVAARATRRTP